MAADGTEGATLRERFAHTKAGHCGSGSLRDVLAFRGLDFGAGPLSEGMAFGLGGGLGFLYSPVPDQPQKVYLVGRTWSLEADFARHLGFDLTLLETDDPELGWSRMRDRLAAGSPVIALADIQRLEYLRVRMENTQHVIVVVDADEDAGVCWIADNDREELQECSLASLAAARNSTGFPAPNRHRIYDYAWPDALAAPEPAVRAAVQTAVANMAGGGIPIGGLGGVAGLAGVDAFAVHYPDWPAAFGDGLDGALAGLWAFIVKAGTGGAMFRSLHAEFLADAGALLEDEGLARAARVYDGVAAAWVALAEAAAARDHAAGVPLAVEVATMEREGVAAMRAWLGSSE